MLLFHFTCHLPLYAVVVLVNEDCSIVHCARKSIDVVVVDVSLFQFSIVDSQRVELVVGFRDWEVEIFKLLPETCC